MGYCTGECKCGWKCCSNDDFCESHICGSCLEADDLEKKSIRPTISSFQRKSIKEWTNIFIDTSKKAGWGGIEYKGVSLEDLIKHVPIAGQLFKAWKFTSGFINIIGEMAEIWEAFRKDELDKPCDKAEKMKKLGLRPLTCKEEEAADVYIRVVQWIQDLGVEDIEECIYIKDQLNKAREYKHGGKIV